MGLFGMFRAKETPTPQPPKTEPKPLGPVLEEIARIISGGEEAVLQDAASCARDPKGWFAAHQERYEERGVDAPDDLGLVQWLGLVDILEDRGWVCERDWKDELEDFSYFVRNLKGFQALGLELAEDWLDGDEDVPAWCAVLAEKWKAQGVRMACIDIDSDSYVLFPAAAPQLAQLQGLAGEAGHRIDYVEQ